MGQCCSHEKSHCGSHEKSCCSSGSCSSGSQEERQGGKFTQHLFDLADEAWGEVLKAKIKEYLLSTQGDRMAELAKMVAEANSRRWKHKMEKKQCCADFHEELECFFNQKCKK